MASYNDCFLFFGGKHLKEDPYRAFLPFASCDCMEADLRLDSPLLRPPRGRMDSEDEPPHCSLWSAVGLEAVMRMARSSASTLLLLLFFFWRSCKISPDVALRNAPSRLEKYRGGGRANVNPHSSVCHLLSLARATAYSVQTERCGHRRERGTGTGCGRGGLSLTGRTEGEEAVS